MLNFKKHIITLALSLFFASLHANETASQAIFIKQLQNIKAFESDFQQEVFNEKGKVIQKSLGKFYFDGKKQFNNTLNSPEQVTLLSDGNKLWQIDYDLEQVTINKLDKYLSDSPLALLLDGNAAALEPYNISLDQSNAIKQSIYYLDAKDEYAAIQKIVMSFKQEQLQYIEFRELSGKQIRLGFSNHKSLTSKKVFKADFPKGFSVVDETRS